jgi:hypothetical protein
MEAEITCVDASEDILNIRESLEVIEQMTMTEEIKAVLLDCANKLYDIVDPNPVGVVWREEDVRWPEPEQLDQEEVEAFWYGELHGARWNREMKRLGRGLLPHDSSEVPHPTWRMALLAECRWDHLERVNTMGGGHSILWDPPPKKN